MFGTHSIVAMRELYHQPTAHCHIATLPHCPIAPLPHCPIANFSVVPTIIPRYNPSDLKMAELRRADVPTLAEAEGGRERDSQAEALLLDGLDRYFAGRYEDAIHVWTRVLFLDRSHARARAYIDRARTAIAERQRHSDEMLQASQDLLERGQTDRARDLLSQAVATTGEDERASALRLRLERIERAHAPLPGGGLPIVAAPEVIPGWSWPRKSPSALVVLTAAAASLVFVLVVSRPAVQNWLGFTATSEALAGPATSVILPVPTSSDVALVRARTLYARGRLAEALQALDRVGDDSPQRRDADNLRVEIQRLLLASGPAGAASPLPSRGVGR
jgi:tetratricopeptide (TPR) repeat protein